MDPLLAALPQAMESFQSIAGGLANYAKASADAKVMRYQAKLADRNAVLAGQQSAAQQGLIERRQAQTLGAQRGAILQGGMGTGGSMGAIAAQSGRDALMDAMIANYEGTLAVQNFRQEARMLRAQAKETKKMAGWAMATSLLGATRGAYGSFRDYKAASPSAVMDRSVVDDISPNGPNLLRGI